MRQELVKGLYLLLMLLLSIISTSRAGNTIKMRVSAGVVIAQFDTMTVDNFASARNGVQYTVGALAYERIVSRWQLANIPSNRPVDNITGLAAMNAIRGSAANNIFICGYYGLLIHWSGKTWKIVPELFNKSKHYHFTSVWTAGQSVFTVGSDNATGRGVVYRGNQSQSPAR